MYSNNNSENEGTVVLGHTTLPRPKRPAYCYMLTSLDTLLYISFKALTNSFFEEYSSSHSCQELSLP